MQQHNTAPTALDRRTFGQQVTGLAAAPLLAALPTGSQGASSKDGHLPDAANRSSLIAPSEEHPHAATYMAFASDADGIWTQPSRDNAGLSRVRSDLIDVAKAIGAFEPVKMMVLSASERAAAQALLERASGANPDVHQLYNSRSKNVGGVELILTPRGFNDYWTRDTAPVFVKDAANGNRLTALDFNFNGWGNANSRSREAPRSSNHTKTAAFYQPYANDQKIAAAIAARHQAPLVKSSLVLEGGALEWDGEGCAIVTASSVLHVNRNPQLFDVTTSGRQIESARLKPTAKATVQAELKRLLGVSKVIWLSGTDAFPDVEVDEETDITNGHVDFYAKFLAPGVVAYAYDPHDSTGEKAITARHQRELSGQTDAQGRRLQLVPLVTPREYSARLTRSQSKNFAAGYINFYHCNGAIILPKFGDPEADAAAVKALEPYLGKRRIVQVEITGIASGGGGLHCATSQVPA
ncbi:agmatine deiminase family protein (plasmid) [Diaphorobacter sp. HDW4B]|uniref:agmatine deiminase family protein n=1 Tax=Diaphorobacter sp. HDW4B TaxID=2714925 RepID=UPI00140B3FB9|nr:agmatine deiminase family protein [Diaphorobacter sp. HDW4B]QIL74259.1 agmatine deiminase family protein [Diaphorobacter sp. HDW4B]